eukprot:365861-Chlamydomonas_euryale.AAC.39
MVAAEDPQRGCPQIRGCSSSCDTYVKVYGMKSFPALAKNSEGHQSACVAQLISEDPDKCDNLKDDNVDIHALIDNCQDSSFHARGIP